MIVEISVLVVLIITALAWYFFGNVEEVQKSKPEPMEFSEVRTTRVYSDYIEKGELE